MKALYWHRTYGIHVAGIVIYPGDEESGRQASGFFVGSDIVKALIDAQRVDAKHMIDEITTILKWVLPFLKGYIILTYLGYITGTRT